MTIVINFGDILYWVAIIFGGFFGVYAVGWIIGALCNALYNLPRDLRVEAQAGAAQERPKATPFESKVWGACVALWFILAIAAAVMKSRGYL